MGREPQAEDRAPTKTERAVWRATQRPCTLPPSCPRLTSHHSHQFHQVTPSLKHLLWRSSALHIRSNALTNQTAPLAPPPLPPHHDCPQTTPCTSWAVFSAIWEAIRHPPGPLVHRSAGRKGPTHLPVGGADPHGCPPTRHSLELLFQEWGMGPRTQS